ncbi:hypothetical protein H6F75_00285 [Nodosilinea sp. FACHB-131]|uniref:hypothetical protein n=1 Tax=Cyanophyceae TaxID=3028117 RepID=UPI0016826F8F|nr:hypothetical protein [Nodosilinea sp. FACHB-131]MBD1871907.1 hypothetical protein [Nodosilinea sp. FACHB-131]
MPRAMTGKRRLEILNELAEAEHGLSMYDVVNKCHRFYAPEIMALGDLVTREPGRAGVYHITDEGRSYLAVMQPSQVKGAKKAQQQVAA